MTFLPGRILLGQLTDALGLGGHQIRKVVIVADIRDVARVYVEKLITDEQIPDMIGALKVIAAENVSVDERTGQVTAE